MTAIERFCQIIEHELGLANGQVYLWNQKIFIPPDHRLYIAVGAGTPKPFSNIRRTDGSGEGLVEELTTNFATTLSIDIISRGPEARDRKEDIILALNSTYSQQQQQAFGFYVAPITTGFHDLSSLEETAIPYRFNLSLNIQYKVTKTKSIPYYTGFDRSLIVNP